MVMQIWNDTVSSGTAAAAAAAAADTAADTAASDTSLVACEMCGWLAAVCSMLAFGSFGVPIKSQASRSVDIDPLVFQSYKTFMCFITSWMVLVMGEEFFFTPWGIVSGMFWVPGGVATVYAIKAAGLAIGIGIGSSCIVLVSFIWGIFVFDEQVHSRIGACFAILCLMMGLVGMSYFSSPSHETTTTTTTTANNNTSNNTSLLAITDSMDEEEDETKNHNVPIFQLSDNDDEHNNDAMIGSKLHHRDTPTTSYQNLQHAVNEDLLLVTTSAAATSTTCKLLNETDRTGKATSYTSSDSIHTHDTAFGRNTIPNFDIDNNDNQEEEDMDDDTITSENSGIIVGRRRRRSISSEGSGHSHNHHASTTNSSNAAGGVYLLGGRLFLTQRQLGMLSAAFCGLYGGSIMAPMKYAPSKAKGTHYLISFAIGATIVTLALWVIRYLYNVHRYQSFWKGYEALPSFHLRVMWLAGGTSGLLWSIGNYFSLISVLYLGEGVGYPLVQTSILVSGLWGIFYLKEVQGMERISKWLCSSLLTIFGILLLSYEHHEK